MSHTLAKLPPQAIEFESSVLGAILLEKNALVVVLNVLKPTSFYKDAHQIIYTALLEMHHNGQKIDLFTVAQHLRKTGNLDLVGGIHYLTEITTRINSAENIEEHARIIAESALKRDLITVSAQIQRLAYDDTTDAFDLMDKLQTSFDNIKSNLEVGKQASTIKEVLTEALKSIENNMKVPDGITGVPTGLNDLDRITGGFQPGTLIIIAARPAMGKSAIVLTMIRNAARMFGKKVALFSLEMPNREIGVRMITVECDLMEISTDQVSRGGISEEQLKQINSGIKELIKSYIYIDDSATVSITDLRAKGWKLKNKYGIDMIVVDYLQLMDGDSLSKGNREQAISSISRGLKKMAKDLNIPVIALSQLSREVEKRGDKRPQLSDLRESGAIEQDADIVMFLFRPEVYGITEDEMGNSTKNYGELIIAKHRNGKLDDIGLRFVPSKTKFENMSHFEEFPPVPEATSIHSFPTRAPYKDDEEDKPF